MVKRAVIRKWWMLPSILIIAVFGGQYLHNWELSSAASPLSKVGSAFMDPYPPPLVEESSKQAPYPAPVEYGISQFMSSKESPLSNAASSAIDYIVARKGVPNASLKVIYDETTDYPSLGRVYQVVTLLDTSGRGNVYKLLVDLSDGNVIESISSVLESESEAKTTKFGKLHPALYSLLQIKNEKDMVQVAVWLKPVPGKTLKDIESVVASELATKYPESLTALTNGGKPMDVIDPELAKQIEGEYNTMMDTLINERTRPLIQELDSRGFALTTYDGMPSFAGKLTKEVIVELSNRDEVGMIYLIETEQTTDLDVAIPNAHIPTVWSRGIYGHESTISMMMVINIHSSALLDRAL